MLSVTCCVSRAWGRVLSIAICGVFLATCSFPGSVRPTVKIGLSAPFEGRYRDLGYEVLYAARLAVRQRNEAGGIGGRYLIEFVALNDFNEPHEAVRQAGEMAADPDILGVVGGWAPEVALAAGAEYERLGLAFLAPEIDLDSPLPLAAEAGLDGAYRQLSGGEPPGSAAIWAYAAFNRLLDAFEAATQMEGGPTRTGVQAVLAKD